LNALSPVLNVSIKEFTKDVKDLGDKILKFKSAGKQLRETVEYHKQIARMISRVENMYGYVQERLSEPAKKKAFELKLETYFQELRKLQEQKMSKKLKDLIKEDDSQVAPDAASDVDVEGGPGELTLKLTGLPDGVDLDSVGVDLVAGDDDEGDMDMSGDADSDGAADDDLGDPDLGGDDAGDEEQIGDQMESLNLSDDTVVEIDENMLRREIARMKKLREDADVWSAGEGVDAQSMDDFGGGSDDGEPFLDGEVTTESEKGDDEDMMKEMDDVLPEAEEACETATMESLKRRLGFEKRLQERAKARISSLKSESKKAKGAKFASIKAEHNALVGRYNESVRRAQNFSAKLNESQKSRSRLNSESKQPAKSKAEENLRNQLVAQNLLNTKLVYANKLLQNESLTRRQKANAIERLDEANNLREAKLVYESLVKAFTNNSKPLKESAQILGSASRTTRPASTPTKTLNEGFETDRWATLAGITKK
jgi:hypothetical protein